MESGARNLPRFAEYVSRFADEFFENSPVRCWPEVPTDLPNLPLRADLRHNVFLAIREAFHNVLKHSGATVLWLRLALDHSEVRLEIEDNGRGFAHERTVAGRNVVLMDINLPGMLGTECVSRLKSVAPGLPVLMLTVYDDSEQIFKSLMAGATGYLLKRTPKDKLLEAIREITMGGAPMSRQSARRVVQFFQQIDQMPAGTQRAPEIASLTEREEQVLASLAKGHIYKEIADLLNISFETVRTHVRSIYEKLHVHSRTEAVLKYLGR